jgi:hypothetical protein
VGSELRKGDSVVKASGILSAFFVIGGLLAGAAILEAQQERTPGRPGPEGNPAEVARLLDDWTVTRAREALGLGRSEFPQFAERLREVQAIRRKHDVERRRLLVELARLTALEGNEERIEERLRRLEELDAKANNELRQAYTRLDEVLDVRQRARFRIFEEQIERRKLELLLRARGGEPGRSRPPVRRH